MGGKEPAAIKKGAVNLIERLGGDRVIKNQTPRYLIGSAQDVVLACSSCTAGSV
jgi:hypothetical protein